MVYLLLLELLLQFLSLFLQGTVFLLKSFNLKQSKGPSLFTACLWRVEEQMQDVTTEVDGENNDVHNGMSAFIKVFFPPVPYLIGFDLDFLSKLIQDIRSHQNILSEPLSALVKLALVCPSCLQSYLQDNLFVLEVLDVVVLAAALCLQLGQLGLQLQIAGL